MTTMKNPSHRAFQCGTTAMSRSASPITEAAKALGLTRQALNNLVNGKSGISADMAIRLDRGLRRRRGNMAAAAVAHDLAQARQHAGRHRRSSQSAVTKLHEPRPLSVAKLKIYATGQGPDSSRS